MEVLVTVTDPKAYTHPFTVTLNEYLSGRADGFRLPGRRYRRPSVSRQV